MKSKIAKILCCLLFAFFSCEEDKNITFIETEVTVEDNYIVDVNIPKAIETTDVANNINDAIEKIVSSALYINDTDSISVRSIEDNIRFFNEEFKSFKNDFPDSPQTWEAQIDGDIMYQSPEVISIAITSYINTGGAHGILTITIANFNVENGLVIPKNGLFTNIDAFESVAKPFFEKMISDKGDDFFDTVEYKSPTNIGFNEDGLILLYNVFEIAPYSTGITQFIIPYEEISHLLNFN